MKDDAMNSLSLSLSLSLLLSTHLIYKETIP